MQTAEIDNINNKIRYDEEAINFRPSPNFKHMKKYLKSKFEESSNPSTPNANDDESSCNDTQEEVMASHNDIHPPLPPNSPPPDSPSIITSKKEIEDEDYIDVMNSNSDMSYHTNKSEELVTDYKNNELEEESEKQSEEVMCRNFIRGTCNRGATCIFAHKVILSQLDKVYKFCNDFQNIGCKRRNCTFVHATVFEKESFLRTAYLPPHAFSHLKKNNALPSTSPAEASTPANGMIASGNQPAPPKLDSVSSLSIVTCAPTLNIESRTMLGDVFCSAAAPESTSLKREWTDMDDFSSSPRDFDCSESAAKKCKHCDINEFRLQLIITKTKKLRECNEDLNSKLTSINSKGQRLWTVLTSIIKSALNKSKVPGSSSALLNITEDTKQVLRDQVNMLSSMSAFNEDNNKVLKEQVAILSSMSAFNEKNNKIINSANPDLQSFLTKLLIGSIDPLLSPDGS